MDSINEVENYTNQQVLINTLPKFEAVEFQSISKKYLAKLITVVTIWFIIFVLAWGILFYFQPNNFINIMVAIGILVFFGLLYLNVNLAFKKYGYALREKDILYRRGYIVTRITVVPFNRIQHVSTSQGVLDKFFKLAKLKLFTAGGQGSDIAISGLPPQLANTLKEAVAKKLREENE